MENYEIDWDSIIHEAKLLKKVDDCFGEEIGDNKGIFIIVVDYGEGMEYLIELNKVDSDGCFEPCEDYNASSKFGDMKALKETIINYLKN